MHWCLRETKNDEVFETDTIIKLLNFKWTYFKYYARFECLLLFVYVTTIVWHSYYLENKLLRALLCLYSVLFFFIEVISFFGSMKIYFSDLINVGYIFNLLLLVTYLIIEMGF